MGSETVNIRYFPENFNFLFSVLNTAFEREKNPSFRDSLYNLMEKIKGAHQWSFSDRIYLVMEYSMSDLTVINYAYEVLFMETWEAGQRIYGKTDYFRVMYDEDARRQAAGDGK